MWIWSSPSLYLALSMIGFVCVKIAKNVKKQSYWLQARDGALYVEWWTRMQAKDIYWEVILFFNIVMRPFKLCDVSHLVFYVEIYLTIFLIFLFLWVAYTFQTIYISIKMFKKQQNVHVQFSVNNCLRPPSKHWGCEISTNNCMMKHKHTANLMQIV